MAILNNSNAISAGGYDVNNSLRFRASASASLTRTPGSAGNRRTFTLSAWVKRGIVNDGTSPHQFLYSASTSTTFNAIDLYQNKIRINFGNGTYLLVTNAVYRDPSAWYHIVMAVDTTQATDTNRVKLYINNVQQSFASGTYPTQNYDTSYNNTVAQRFGVNDASDYFDGYLAEVNFIDGSAKTPSDFGETDATTGVWKPKAYTGTYGTNGFYLKFSDIATTSGSNAGLGKDFSGNTNYWTTNNISVTSGTTYDAMTDSPTNTSATVANYCVASPLNYRTSAPAPQITNGNLTWKQSSTTASSIGSATFGVSSGKWYYEATFIVSGGGGNFIGWLNGQFSNTTANDLGFYSNEYAIRTSNGDKYNNNTFTSYGSSFANGDIIGCALDLDAGTMTFYKNNTSFGTAFSSLPSGGTWFPAFDSYNNNGYDLNFGQRPFAYTPPTGYVALNTYNLPTPTILQGNKYMDANLWTGNSSTQVIVNNAQFKPDFVWAKSRSNAYQNALQDSVRGAGKTLFSALTNAEAGNSGDLITSFNSNGFTVNTTYLGGFNETTNNSGSTYVGWQWQAGQGSTSSNTQGSITSTVSVNTTAGFSIVTYTGSGSNATVGHGLGVAPSMVIVKSRTTAENWMVYHTSTGATKYIYLDSTGAAVTLSTIWNNTAPTSSVFSIGTNVTVNQSSTNYVAYCWAEIAGFSKFGSYTGNGSTDGPFSYFGFRPKFVMIKNITTAGYPWVILDSARNTYNPENLELYPNTSGAEGSGGTTYIEDFLSNGFKVRQTDATFNASGSTYIYMAFAENPTKHALAR